MGNCSQKCDCGCLYEENVVSVKTKMLGDDELLAMADFYRALADSTRIKIINALCINELCVSDISALINMTKSAVSHQLNNLKEMKLIKSRKKGKEVWYSLADEHVREVFEISKTHIVEEWYAKS